MARALCSHSPRRTPRAREHQLTRPPPSHAAASRTGITAISSPLNLRQDLLPPPVSPSHLPLVRHRKHTSAQRPHTQRICALK